MENISLKDINTSIKKVFKDSEALASEPFYEPIRNTESLKLIIPFDKLYTDNDFSVIFTKIILITNIEKTNITKNTFLYLYDLNDEYNKIDFEDIEDFEKKLKNIFKKQLFGKDIKILTEFIKHPSMSMNNWLRKNMKDENFSILNVEYVPIKDVLKGFDFKITMANIGDVNINIKKENDTKYTYTFKFGNSIKTEVRRNLNDLISTIIQQLKNNVI